MRLKFIATILLLTGVILGLALYLKGYSRNTVAPHIRAEITAASTVVSNVVTPVASAEAPFPAPPTNSLTPEKRQAAVEAEIDRLQQVAPSPPPPIMG